MAGQITLTMSLIFIALFSIAIFGFAIGFANDTGAVMSISDDPEISKFYSNTRTNLSTFKDKAEGTLCLRWVSAHSL